MPTEDAEFRQGEPGVDEQLGQGETQELNDGLDLAKDMAAGNESELAETARPGRNSLLEKMN